MGGHIALRTNRILLVQVMAYALSYQPKDLSTIMCVWETFLAKTGQFLVCMPQESLVFTCHEVCRLITVPSASPLLLWLVNFFGISGSFGDYVPLLSFLITCRFAIVSSFPLQQTFVLWVGAAWNHVGYGGWSLSFSSNSMWYFL